MNTTVISQGNISEATKFVMPTGKQYGAVTPICRDLCPSKEEIENAPGEEIIKDNEDNGNDNNVVNDPSTGNNDPSTNNNSEGN